MLFVTVIKLGNVSSETLLGKVMGLIASFANCSNTRLH